MAPPFTQAPHEPLNSSQEEKKKPEATTTLKNYCRKEGLIHCCTCAENKQNSEACCFYKKHSRLDRCTHYRADIQTDKDLSHCDSLLGQIHIYLSEHSAK